MSVPSLGVGTKVELDPNPFRLQVQKRDPDMNPIINRDRNKDQNPVINELEPQVIGELGPIYIPPATPNYPIE